MATIPFSRLASLPGIRGRELCNAGSLERMRSERFSCNNRRSRAIPWIAEPKAAGAQQDEIDSTFSCNDPPSATFPLERRAPSKKIGHRLSLMVKTAKNRT